MRRLWSTLEELPGLAAPLMEWRDRLGEDFAGAKRLLRPTDDLVTTLACPSPGGDGCPRRVVEHGNGEIVAVCGDRLRHCESLKLSRVDIVIYRLDPRGLCEAVAEALDLTPSTSGVAGHRAPCHVGDYQPVAGMRFPIYLGIQADPDAMRATVTGLCGAVNKPFILLTPTVCSIDLEMTGQLNRHRARFAALADILHDDGSGNLAANAAAQALLAEFHAAVMPKEKTGPPVRFPTPPGATWSNVVIQFVDGHTVSIKCKSVSGRYNYTQMGMVDRRTSDPDVQWRFLRELADGHGQMDWSHSSARRENKKRKQTLNRRLLAFFGIEGEPITWDKQVENYRCRFQLIPD